MPIFVVIGKNTDGPMKKLFMGLAKDYDNNRQKFLMDILDKFPKIPDSDLVLDQNHSEDFQPCKFEQADKKQRVNVQRNQIKFR